MESQSPLKLVNVDAIANAAVEREPYTYFTAPSFLNEAIIPTLRAEFPAITKTGYHPADEMELSPTFRQLVDELESPELTAALSKAFGIDLSPFPRLTTIRKLSASHEGRIHCDSKSKVMTMLVYMNDDWGSPDGRLRVLYSEHEMNKYKLEVSPQMGSIFAFLRADHSWHGHTPFAGERRVIQIAWVRSNDELLRKKKRARFTNFFKRVFTGGTTKKAA